jgi:hypothetical protein
MVAPPVQAAREVVEEAEVNAMPAETPQHISDVELWRTLSYFAGVVIAGLSGTVGILWRQLNEDRKDSLMRDRIVADETRALAAKLAERARSSQPPAP